MQLVTENSIPKTLRESQRSVSPWFKQTKFRSNKFNVKGERERQKVKSLSRVRLFATPWTVAYQASQSMGFSRQEYWSGLSFPSPGGIFPTQGSNPGLPHCRLKEDASIKVSIKGPIFPQDISAALSLPGPNPPRKRDDKHQGLFS